MIVPALGQLEAYTEHYRSDLAARGWQLRLEPGSLSAGGFFKSGQPKRTRSVWLRQFEPVWRIDSWRQETGRHFRDLQTAFGHFLAEVYASHPLQAKGCFTRPDSRK